MEKNIWITGPVELLNHGINHIKKNEEFDFRIAMISIDNAVETTIKSFLNLNRRTLDIKHNVIKDSLRRFPAMLDLLLNHCSDKISADELDAIEMFHTIRNNLYHQGTGITVNKEIVERYAIVAKELISRLFNVEEGKDFEVEIISDLTDLYSEFLMIWREIEIELRNYALISGIIPQTPRPLTIKNIFTTLAINGLIDDELGNNINYILKFRNNIVHSRGDYSTVEIKEYLAQIKEVKEEVLKLIQKK